MTAEITNRFVTAVIVFLTIVSTAQAKYGGSSMAASAVTSTYVFVPDQSKLVQTAGIAGVHWTYSVKGEFDLTIDLDGGTAFLADVVASATRFRDTLDPNKVFNMASLVGTVVDDATIKFTGKASDGSDVRITVTLQDNLAHLIGQTTPPPNSTDFFIFNLDAVAQRKYGGGSGTAEDPYHIATADDLMVLGESPEVYDKHFILTADIDLGPNLPGRHVFAQALIPTFTGVFDGNGHRIWHLTITGAGGRLGLFGCLGYETEVKNLGVVDVNITGSGDCVGGLAGWNNGDVTGCYSTGEVSGKGSVGGLVGYNDYGRVSDCYRTVAVSGTEMVGGLVGSNSGDVTECYSTGAVSGELVVGGLVGNNWGAVTHCYSTGAVTGGEYVGGLAGGNWNGTVTQCYSTGAVSGNTCVGGLVGSNQDGTVTGCFWSTQTSGQASSDGGKGKTTAEMQTASTFLDAGWDFVGETANGTEDIWAICEGVDYPHLAWEFVIGDFDADAYTDFADFCILAEHWLAAYGSFWCGQGCDLTNDGSVNWQDLMVFAENWLTDISHR
jgi:hypothetical protein